MNNSIQECPVNIGGDQVQAKYIYFPEKNIVELIAIADIFSIRGTFTPLLIGGIKKQIIAWEEWEKNEAARDFKEEQSERYGS